MIANTAPTKIYQIEFYCIIDKIMIYIKYHRLPIARISFINMQRRKMSYHNNQRKKIKFLTGTMPVFYIYRKTKDFEHRTFRLQTNLPSENKTL